MILNHSNFPLGHLDAGALLANTLGCSFGLHDEGAAIEVHVLDRFRQLLVAFGLDHVAGLVVDELGYCRDGGSHRYQA